MKYLSVNSLKGGVGKTCLIFNLSSMLAKDGYKILVVDCDAQGNTTSDFGVDDSVADLKTIVEVFEGSVTPEEVVIISPIKELPTLDLLPSSIMLTSTEMRIVNYSGREYILKNYFKKYKDYFNKYDYIFFDTNPSMNGINIACNVNADGIILITDIGRNGLKGTQLFTALWDGVRNNLNLENNVVGFIINRFDKRIRMSKEFVDYCETDEDIKPILFNTKIPEDIKLREAELESKPIVISNKKSRGYEAYTKLIIEMKTRGVL